ncbi:hypothetical protein M0R19_04085 [Candidatus Pacearchaeota archaeon]|jgi:hypothetical protein|nr:hypothetical protein [Candidatus Pacearchaeota archaeon]
MNKHKLNKNDFIIDEIESIELYGEGNTVDITIESEHMYFLSNGVLTHNSGLNAEVITMESISEAFNKCFVADFIFSVSRTIEDKNKNVGRMFIAKNRNGIDGIIYPMEIDTSNVSIKVLEKLNLSISEINEQTENNTKKLLNSKYKAFKSGVKK